MKPTVVIYTPQELNQSSYFRTGLFELENLGVIKCRIVLDTSPKRGRISTSKDVAELTDHPFPKASYYKLISDEGEIKFCIDAYDIPYYFSEYALKTCDFVFKRNFMENHILKLHSMQQLKVYPLGLTFVSVSQFRHHTISFFIGMLLGNYRLITYIDKSILKRLWVIFRNVLKHYRFTENARVLDSFRAFVYGTNSKVLFQTRCFETHYADQDARNIHEERATIIRLFRKKLPRFFCGGLVPGRIAKKLYSDCLTDLPTDPENYLRLVKESSICVYTRGLKESPAWKMAEYLSQGKCIVAERLITQLPEPLVDGVHLRYFDTPEECLAICQELLHRTDEVKRLSQNAREYYEKFVDPAISTRRVLELMLKKKLDE